MRPRRFSSLRRPSLSVVVVVTLAACSTGDSSDAGPTPSATAADSAARSAGSEPSADASGSAALATAEVAVEVTTRGDTSTLSASLAESDDPFGTFVSCSGLRDSFGTYSVLASAPDSTVRSVSAVTLGVVESDGVHDGAVRVEFADGSATDGVGTVTLLPGYQAGSFSAVVPGGGVVDGSFSCTGRPAPEPLVLGADDGVVDEIDIVARLRAGDEERLVSLAATDASGATLECPGATSGPPGDVIVAVDGDDSIGAITGFRLADAGSPSLTMRVGETEYRFEDVEVGELGDPSAGSFEAIADGIGIDGAYRCT